MSALLGVELPVRKLIPRGEVSDDDDLFRGRGGREGGRIVGLCYVVLWGMGC